MRISRRWALRAPGFAPGATFGQWVSALARHYAISGSPPGREKVLRLNRLYAATISEALRIGVGLDSLVSGRQSPCACRARALLL